MGQHDDQDEQDEASGGYCNQDGGFQFAISKSQKNKLRQKNKTRSVYSTMSKVITYKPS